MTRNNRLYANYNQHSHPEFIIENTEEIASNSNINNSNCANSILNYYFMLGDNRTSSIDSRSWGFLEDLNVIGEAKMVLFSTNPEADGFLQFRFRRILHAIK